MSDATAASRILVVDDEPEIRDLACLVLGGAGYDVRAVSSGRAALGLVGRERFDLMLLDINMPEMDGWETLRLIRADHALERLPVVMFSVKDELRDKIQGLQEGATDYITKPFVVDTLIERVGRVIEAVQRRDAGSGPREGRP